MESSLPKIDDYWYLSPDTFAQTISRGRWVPYDWVVYLSNILRKRIAQGNARIIIEAPPRHGKSELISHWVPTWFLNLYSDHNVAIASYAVELSAQFGFKVRDSMNMPEIQTSLRPDSKAKHRFNTTHGGGLIATGIGAGLTGRGFHLGIIDDPIKDWKQAMSPTYRQTCIDWFRTVFYTRCEPGASIIALATRWHEDDLLGWLQKSHDDKWEVIRLPAFAELDDVLGRKSGQALCPQRYDETKLGQIERSLGARFFNAMFQQRPSPIEGNIWKISKFKRYTEPPIKFDEVVQSWDLNAVEGGSSYAVGQVWGRVNHDKYLLFQVRGKWGFTETIEQIRIVTSKFPNARKKLIEKKANGPAVEDTLRREMTGIVLIEPDGGKEVRAIACEHEIESGHIHIPDEEKNPWVQEFLEEVKLFPNGKNDDQVDTASQAINYFSKNARKAFANLVKL